MPLTSKGEKIRKAMKKEYGAEKGEQVFYASKNKGTISGVDKVKVSKDAKGHVHVRLDAGVKATVARGVGQRLRDMDPAKFQQLKALLGEFLSEEAKEPEHQTDCNGKKDCGCGCKG